MSNSQYPDAGAIANMSAMLNGALGSGLSSYVGSAQAGNPVGGLPVPAGVAQSLLGNLFQDKLPSDPLWYHDMRALIHAALKGRLLTAEVRDKLWKVNALLGDLLSLDSEMDDFAVERYRSAIQHLANGKKLNYYDEKMLEEVCSLLARVQGLKTEYKISGVSQDATDPSKIRIDIDFRPVHPVEMIEIEFKTVQAYELPDGVEHDADDHELTHTVMKRVVDNLQAEFNQRVTVDIEKAQLQQMQQQQMPHQAAQGLSNIYLSPITGGLSSKSMMTTTGGTK